MAEEELEKATEAENKTVALLIAILALFLALAEAGAKNAEHRSTEHNIEASDLYNFYQAKKIRSTVVETATQQLETNVESISDEKTKGAAEKQIAYWKAQVAKYEKDPKHPEDSMETIVERAKEATELREKANQKLEHFEFASGALQIAIVLASASIISGVALLAWVSGILGLVGIVLMAFGYLAPNMLPFFL
jgi:small-conductance mechanosensitive channel